MGSAPTHRKTPRASVACIKCRVRKVRCDVARRGHPCTNCVLDQKDCAVLPRSRKTPRRPRTAVDDHGPPSLIVPSSSEDGSHHTDTGRETRFHDVPFQAYSHMRTDFLSRLAQEDIWLLESRSCLRLPVRVWWNDMLQVYFDQIDPLVPLFDKGNFRGPTGDDGHSTLSLFVAQAMLFAACPFASQRTIRGCGFTNCREARAAFYQRAKLLYQLESESHSVAIIQGSLLLSLCSTTRIESPVNSVWLSIAIQHARSVGAHLPDPRGTTLSSNRLHLKRLWWVCLIRDRILSLGYRRPLQISDEPRETELNVLSSPEFFEDMCRLDVHSATVRRALFAVFISLCHLCLPLTRILNLAVPIAENTSTALKQADICADDLNHWLEDTLRRLETPDLEAKSQAPVVLHSHLLQIYFNAARLHILNFRIMVVGSSETGSSQYEGELQKSGSEVEASVEAITNTLSTLALRNLVGYLPTAAVMCTVLPFVLTAAYGKLVPPEGQTEPSRKRPEVFHDVIRALQTRYNNVKPVTNVVEKVLTVTKPRQSTKGWPQLIESQPASYIRALRTLDLLLSTGRNPCDSDSRHSMTTECSGVSDPIDTMEPVDIGCTEITHFAGSMDQWSPDEQCTDQEESYGCHYLSHWTTEAQQLVSGEEVGDSPLSDPFICDILELCEGQDMDTLLNII